jgi:serine-type D-Ala-D-Ala endopeptidase (penicillin-binding protein 7)
VRGIRPLHLARLLVLSVPLGVIAPWAALPAAAQAKPAPAKATQTPAYSAKAAEERKARLARARAAAAAREQARLRAERALREAMTPRYKTDEATGTLVPDIRAAAAIIFDPVTGQVLWEENAQDKRSIASITKVMTAVVLLENDPDLSRRVVIDRSDVLAASVTYLRAGDRITLDHLLHLTLIASDNGAARALARTSPGGSKAFIQRMNEKAIDLGLDSTSFADPSGLNPDNISSAYDLSRLIVFASHDERIAAIMRRVTFTARTHNRSFEIRNTNHLVRGGEVDVLGGKTGFIRKAGYCLATLLQLPQSQHQVAVVVLGAGSNNGRFWETRHLFNWLADRATEMFASAATAYE